MKKIAGFGLLAGLALAACTPGAGGGGDTGAVPSGGSAGAMGPEFCESPPTDPDAMTQWNELCSPDRR